MTRRWCMPLLYYHQSRFIIVINNIINNGSIKNKYICFSKPFSFVIWRRNERKRKSKHSNGENKHNVHPYSVVWMLWALKRRTNDVLCILSAQLTFTLNYHSLEDHITLSECREPLKDVQTTYCMFILYMSYVCCVHVLNVHPN